MAHLAHFHLKPFLFLILTTCFLAGCGSASSAVCPFTEIVWEDTLEDITALEGEPSQTYPSVYNGSVYVYPKKYQSWDGNIKYMFDDKNELMCISWTYDDSDSSVTEIYQSIHEQLEASYGESGYSTNSSSNYGDVWYLDEGNIILSAVTTDSQNALQYSYLNPAVSEKPEN